MRALRLFIVAVVSVVSVAAPLLTIQTAHAAGLASENFTGVSTPANAWISGGTGGSVACLTAATSSAANSIPACAGGPLDTVGNGVLRLTPNTNAQSGFAIYNTPVSASDGLNITFDMFQYGGSGADGISFFLIDGAASPTQPGAAGGSLGYSSNIDGDPGIEGGYVGVGFDRFGNFSDSDFGSGGVGPVSNSITVRGSEDSGYAFVTTTPADGSLSGTTRTNSLRRVKINISTNNVMTVAVDYGSGYVTELSDIDLEAINGEGSLPTNFKFGFAASTGGSTNTHAIRGLSVETNPPSVDVNVSHSGNFTQGDTGQFTLAASNDSAAEATDGLISIEQTLPAGLTPTSAAGTGWSCNINDQIVTCTRPGSGGDALQPGASTPAITVGVQVANNAAASLNTTATLTTPGNSNSAQASDTDTVTVLDGSYLDDDSIFNAVEDDAPNSGDGNDDGTADGQQDTVTSLPNPVTNNYATLETDGCAVSNSNVSIAAESANAATDEKYTYPLGLMDFSIDCSTPGGTATVTQYYFGASASPNMVLRKYNSVTNTYQTLPGATLTNVQIGGQSAIKVVYSITDGGLLDEDGVANGTIVDPAGLAVLSDTITAPTTDSTPGVPNTGFASHSMGLYYAAGLIGTGILAYEAIALRRFKKARKTLA